MAFRTEQDSLIKTTVLAYQLKDGSSHEPFWIQPLEWCTGIFRRRFDRPGNSLIRHNQITETIPMPQPLFAVSRISGGSQNRFEDDPLPPPPRIQSMFPDFDACVPDKCGNHVLPKVHPDTLVDCYKCNGTFAVKSLHALPCGHYVCRKDLGQLAMNAFAVIQDGCTRIFTQETLSELWQMKGQLTQLVRQGADAATLQIQQRRTRNHMVFVRHEVGLVCCGRDTNLLETHIRCLEPRMARGLWTVEMFLSANPYIFSRRCGWPDCEHYVPPQCIWFDGRMGDGLAERWHCVICGGNSKRQSNNEHNGLQPAR
ncbi:hypothetical protein VP1G_01653 [Cytospora mali]|uniref:Uncharacterized protein n=1 Tax=Cytospora mali TaxID=578113 RepID=A0A194UR96_CYTMA|nr:hypothetical protein VP1G_01653 [Valsa mali var. pyri (nom. inval.)]